MPAFHRFEVFEIIVGGRRLPAYYCKLSLRYQALHGPPVLEKMVLSRFFPSQCFRFERAICRRLFDRFLSKWRILCPSLLVTILGAKQSRVDLSSFR